MGIWRSINLLYERFAAPIAEQMRFIHRDIGYSFRKGKGLPLISIVVPLYNEERFILFCLKSIEKQTYRNIECIVVDDGSTDSSPKLVKSFIKKDTRFMLISHKKNRGLPATRNTGLKKAKGRYITFLDADDYILPNSLWHRLVAVNNTDQTVAGSFCEKVLVDEQGNSPQLRLRKYLFHDTKVKDFISSDAECPFIVSAPLLKTAIIKRFGGFDESLKVGCEDWDLWLKMLRNGYRFVPSGNCGVAYRQKKGSMVHKMYFEHMEQAARLIDKAYSELAENEKIKNGPFIFSKPLPFYKHQISLAKRMISYYTMAFISNDGSAANRIISRIQSDTWYYLGLHVNFEDIVDSTLERFSVMTDSGKENKKMIRKRKQEIIRRIQMVITTGGGGNYFEKNAGN